MIQKIKNTFIVVDITNKHKTLTKFHDLASESVSQMFYRNDIIMKDSSPQMNINDQIYNQSADVNADIDKLDVSQKDKVSLPHLSNDNQDINYNSNTEMEDKENKELAHKYSKPNIDQLKSKCEQDHCYNIPYQDKTNFETPGKAVSSSFIFCLFIFFKFVHYFKNG